MSKILWSKYEIDEYDLRSSRRNLRWIQFIAQHKASKPDDAKATLNAKLKFLHTTRNGTFRFGAYDGENLRAGKVIDHYETCPFAKSSRKINGKSCLQTSPS